MSYNLHLTADKDRAECGLYQTPTNVTYRALADNGAKAKDIYFAWLDGEVQEKKPAIHPRATNAQIKKIQSTPEYKDYIAFKESVAFHKIKVEEFLQTHPDAAWWGM